MRAHRVGVQTGVVPSVGRRGVEVRLQEGQGAGRLAHGEGVQNDEGVIAIEQLVGQVDAPDAVVLDPHALRKGSAVQAVRHLDAEPVVGLEDVADARHQDAAAHRSCLCATSGSTSSGWKNR